MTWAMAPATFSPSVLLNGCSKMSVHGPMTMPINPINTVSLNSQSFTSFNWGNSSAIIQKPLDKFSSFISRSKSGSHKEPVKEDVATMYEKFNEEAIEVIVRAEEETRRLGHNFVGTDQILLALIGDRTGIAGKKLISAGITLEAAREAVEEIIGRESDFVCEELIYSPRAMRVLHLSFEEARRLGDNYVGPQHLLSGLLREGEGVAARVLQMLGVDPAELW